MTLTEIGFRFSILMFVICVLYLIGYIANEMEETERQEVKEDREAKARRAILKLELELGRDIPEELKSYFVIDPERISKAYKADRLQKGKKASNLYLGSYSH